MGSSLTEKAVAYRKLSETLSDPRDVATALEFANLLEDIGRLEVPVHRVSRDLPEKAIAIGLALNRIFKPEPHCPVSLELLFKQVLDEGACPPNPLCPRHSLTPPDRRDNPRQMRDLGI